MARIQWHSSSFTADPIEQLPNGNWIMTAKEHGPRFGPGTMIEVKQSEIAEMAAAETPPDPAASAAALDVAMAEERKTLPTPAELIKAANEKAGGV